MSKLIKYLDLKQQGPALEIIAIANGIIKDYRSQGFDLTLRQLYYQFVAGNKFPQDWLDDDAQSFNTEKNYKRLGGILKNGRLSGRVDWESMVDRTRNLVQLNHFNDPGDFMLRTLNWFNRDLWATQQCRVEVWIEKDALLGVISDYCNNNDIPHFSCRGYTSTSEMWVAGQRIAKRLLTKGNTQGTVLLHLGDHDPSGLDMSRDIEDRLKLFVGRHVNDGGDLVFVKRIALTPAQIEQYDPPPNPAKKTDARFKKYKQETGMDQSWELDALEPAVMIGIIKEAVDTVRDQDAWDEAESREKTERNELEEVADRWDEVTNYLKDN